MEKGLVRSTKLPPTLFHIEGLVYSNVCFFIYIHQVAFIFTISVVTYATWASPYPVNGLHVIGHVCCFLYIHQVAFIFTISVVTYASWASPYPVNGLLSLVRHTIAPTQHWFDTPLVRHTIGPTHHWSDTPSFRHTIGPTING